MGIESFIEIILQQGIWCALFCYIYFTTSNESKNRENLLLNKLDEYNDSLHQITCTLEKMNTRIEVIEEKIAE